MGRLNLIEKTEEFVKLKHAKFGTSHGWWHVSRTRDLALYIASEEGADSFLVELSALLRDVDDHKFTGSFGDTPYSALGWLVSQEIGPPVIDAVIDVISKISFSKGIPTAHLSLEGRCVSDADRLDALGAIGIARVFTYGGYSGKLILEPSEALPQDDLEASPDESNGTSLDHIWEAGRARGVNGYGNWQARGETPARKSS